MYKNPPIWGLRYLKQAQVKRQLHGPGILLDFHGQTHTHNKTELGYSLSSEWYSHWCWMCLLNWSTLIPGPNLIKGRNNPANLQSSSIDALAKRTRGGHKALIWGDKGLGALMGDHDYMAVPSKREQVLHFNKLILYAHQFIRSPQRTTLEPTNRTRLYINTVPEMVMDRFDTIWGSCYWNPFLGGRHTGWNAESCSKCRGIFQNKCLTSLCAETWGVCWGARKGNLGILQIPQILKEKFIGNGVIMGDNHLIPSCA